MVKDDAKNYGVSLRGVFDDEAEFPSLQVPADAALHFDLEGFRAINSVGIKLFMEWVHGLAVESMDFARCPKVFVDQLNMVPGFLPGRAKISSFYVPYYNEETQEEVSALYHRGVHYRKPPDGPPQILPPQVSGANKKPLEIDILPERYFRFLETYG